MKPATGISNSTMDHYQSSHLSSEESINQIIKAPQTPHQHFHKKYLREQTLKQQEDEEKKHNQEQLHINSYIVAKSQHLDARSYVYPDERDFIVNYNNNNPIVGSNYEKAHEYELKAIDYATPKANSYSSGASSSSSSSPSPKQKQHPNNIPYDPLVHTASKPPYSFRFVLHIVVHHRQLLIDFSFAVP